MPRCSIHPLLCATHAACIVALTACGGGGSSPAPAAAPAPPPPPPAAFSQPDSRYRVSGPSTLGSGCEAVAVSGTLYMDAEVEPHVSMHPADPLHLVGAWQQNRWSGGGAQGVLIARSDDGGVTWTRTAAPLSRCTGGTPGNGADYERASDPWTAIAPDGTAYVMSLSLNVVGNADNAMLVVRSTDGGRTWGDPITLIRDGADAFNDKNAMLADPLDARFAYAVWDRLSGQRGPTWFARTTDGGASWEPARAIFDPGDRSQTLGNVPLVVRSGTHAGALLVFFSQIDNGATAALRVIRSTDRGTTWSAPISVNALRGVGAYDPQGRLAVRDGVNLPSVAAAPNGDVYAVWQDARATAGEIDGVLFVRSADGGLTWSDPVQVNRMPATQAFTPTIAVRADGTIGVTHFDLRNDTPDPATLPTDYWLVQSGDGGVTWSETHLSGAFDLMRAPNARGFFVGDYQGLVATDSTFLPFHAQVTLDGNANRTDVFALASARAMHAQRRSGVRPAYAARAVAPVAPGLAEQTRVAAAVARTLAQRVPGDRHR